MKKIVLITVSLILTLNSFAQKDTAYFKDGTIIPFEILYDDPSHLPKWEVDINFFTFMLVSEGALCMQLRPSYKIDDKMYVDFRLTVPYTKGLDQSTSNYKEISRLSIDLTPQFHYKLFTVIQHKDRTLTLKNDGSTAYKLERVRNFGRNLYVDAGFNYFQSNLNRYLTNVNDDQLQDHFLGGYSSTSISGGLTYTKTESYKVKKTEGSFTNWNRIKWYTTFNYALSESKDIYNVVIDGSNSINTTRELADIDELDGVNFKGKFNYRVGFDLTFGMKKNIPFHFGFQFGSIPFYEDNKGKPLTSNSIIMFRLGFGIVERL